MNDVWEDKIELWPARRIGWHWFVNTHLNGHPDPFLRTVFPWALRRSTALRRARKQLYATRECRALGRKPGLITLEG